MVLVVGPSVQACTLSTRVRQYSSFFEMGVDMHFTIAISIGSFVEMIRFFTTLILNADESELL